MKPTKLENWLLALAFAVLMALSVLPKSLEDSEALCHTDSECAELCPPADRELPPDHPLYCDGGPQ